MIDRLASRLGRTGLPPRQRALSLMERAPQFVIYALHGPYTLYLTLRFRGLMLPTAANPGLEGSGLTNESKAGLFDLLGPVGRAHLAPFVAITTGPRMLEEAKRTMEAAGLSFPVVAKPDIGRRGFGVKAVRSEPELAEHLGKFPVGVRLIIQRYVEGPGEAAISYLRRPSEEHGRILALTIKHFPEVVGDGTSTVRELILQDPRARSFADLYFKRNRKNLDQVIPAGERYRIVSVGNHVRGSAFEDGSTHITPAMQRVFETIVREVPGFFVGRFDVRYTTLESLKRGEGFSIVEYNGAGGEPTHIWDPRTSVVATYAGLLTHWRSLYALGAENRALGAQPMRFSELVRRYFNELRLLRSYPDEE